MITLSKGPAGFDPPSFNFRRDRQASADTPSSKRQLEQGVASAGRGPEATKPGMGVGIHWETQK